MSIKYNKSLRTISQGVVQFFGDLFWTIFSMVLILFLSSFRAARRFRRDKIEDGKNCYVLGNGPSLKDDLDNDEVNYTDGDVICVNMFCKSEYFEIVKPRYYCLVDRVFFMPVTPRHHKLVEDLVAGLNKVEWEMELLIPAGIPCDDLMKKLNNSNLKVKRINNIWIKGFKGFCHCCYSKQLAIPRCENILGVVLTLAVAKGYKNIYVYGADHSWTRDMYVDDDNVVCYGDRHVYHKDLQIVKMSHPLYIELSSFATVFKAHLMIEEYAKSRECNIYNCTKGSFIDAYQRM